MSPTIRTAVLLLLFVPFSARAGVTCEDVLEALGNQLADRNCFQSADLTTNNPVTTPANNSLAGLPAGAFTPVTDRGVIAPSADKRPPITKAVPGLQLDARIASDPTGQARFLLRLPNDWNGRLVVAGASGTRSEFNAISPGAITSCSRATPTPRRTRACSIFSLSRRIAQRLPRTRSPAASTRLPFFGYISSTTIPDSLSPAGPNS